MTSLSQVVLQRPPRAPWPWLATVAGLALVGWSALGTQTDPAVFLRPGTITDISAFVTRTFPPDLSPAFMRQVASGALETFAIFFMGTLLALMIAVPHAFFATRTILFAGVLYAREDLGWSVDNIRPVLRPARGLSGLSQRR